jgi:hypothetical protein
VSLPLDDPFPQSRDLLPELPTNVAHSPLWQSELLLHELQCVPLEHPRIARHETIVASNRPLKSHFCSVTLSSME